MTEEKVTEILKYIEDNLNNSIRIDDLSDVFHYDRSYLSRSFKKLTDISLIDYINERKIIKSIYYVVNTDDKMLKIALNSGFNSLEYFSETFYRVTNFSPTSLRDNTDINGLLPFNDIISIESLKENHSKILKIRSLYKPKTKVFGTYR
jgi:AraC family transcriptional regulator of adaptative response / methylphosphotriester-DNA alkyltransferase methyltransferase